MGKTSSEVKNRYNRKRYAPIGVQLNKELVAEFRARIAERDDTIADVFRNAIKAYLSENPPQEKN